MLKRFAVSLSILVLAASLASPIARADRKKEEEQRLRSFGSQLCNALTKLGSQVVKVAPERPPAPQPERAPSVSRRAPPPVTEPPRTPLSSDSVVLDSNLAIDLLRGHGSWLPEKIAGRVRSDIRVSPHVQAELGGNSSDFTTFQIDPVKVADRTVVLDQLVRLKVGEDWVPPPRPGRPPPAPQSPRKNAWADQAIVAQVLLAARTNPLERPVFMTHDAGIFMHLLEASRFKGRGISETQALSRFNPNGFEVEILGHKILVVPVPPLPRAQVRSPVVSPPASP